MDDDAIVVDETTSGTTETTLETNSGISETVGVEESEQAESTEGNAPQKIVVPEDAQRAVKELMGRQAIRFKGKIADQTDVTTAAIQRAEKAENTVRLQQLALDQKSETGPPQPDQFDEGEYDPAYIQAREQFTADSTAKLVRETINSTFQEHLTANDTAATQRVQADAKQQRQIKHYEQAMKLDAPDYEDAEVAVIDQLGIGVVEEIIEREPNSAAMIYFLQKNPDRAKALKKALGHSAYEGVIAISDLRRHIKPATKSSTAPTPTDKVESSRSASSEGGPKGATYE